VQLRQDYDGHQCLKVPSQRAFKSSVWTADYANVEVFAEVLAKAEDRELRAAYNQPSDHLYQQWWS
jgi:hypothetical protein